MPESDTASRQALRQVDRTAPEVIYLDVLDEIGGASDFRDHAEVTWSADNATGEGVRYIRSDLVDERDHEGNRQPRQVSLCGAGTTLQVVTRLRWGHRSGGFA